jgi:hypothetical protein
MAKRSGGLKGLKVAVFPTPKGWESTGKYWATFHTWQELEQDHDPIYRVVDTPQGLELGSEIPESDCGGHVDKLFASVQFDPARGTAVITTTEFYSGATPGRSLLFRLNDSFEIGHWSEQAAKPGRHLPGSGSYWSKEPLHGIRSGGLLAYVPSRTSGWVSFDYTAHVGDGAPYSEDRDQVTTDYAYLASYWIPSLARLPVTTDISVMAPEGWTVRSEGKEVYKKPSYQGFTESRFHCDVPISYPKVMGGDYVVALEGHQNGHLLRTYQFAPIDKTRAAKDLVAMKKAIAFYEANLGPFPFAEYDCLDGKHYYGIESYSYTVLDPTITTDEVSHEMGHTYFGGLVPCPYVKDSWNEGVTQYVDDVLIHHSPEVAANALAGVNIHVPLTNMPVAWELDGATYWRGGYAMQMLDAEIGHDKVLQGLRLLIKDREGKDTTWPDLRQYFEKASGQDLKWFWDQWISGSVFPHVSISSVAARQEGGKWMTRVIVHQSGTDSPFRLRFAIRLDGDSRLETPELLSDADHAFEISTDFQPKMAKIEPNPTALISVDAPIAVAVGM